MNNPSTPSTQPARSISSGQSSKQIAPIIHSITNGVGELILDGATTLNADLTLTGSAAPDQYIDIRDSSYLFYPRVYVDGEGKFSVELLNQPRAILDYRIRTEDGQESATWSVVVDFDRSGAITSFRDPDNEVRGNGGETRPGELTFVGVGEPGQVVELLHEGAVLQTVNVDANGGCSAVVNGLSGGRHVLTARKPGKEQSTPWRILIHEPSPLSIEFVKGKGNSPSIANGESTTYRTLTLVGTASPGETGWIADEDRNLAPFAANEYGVYSATVEYLAVGRTHALRLESDLGRTSPNWVLTVDPWFAS